MPTTVIENNDGFIYGYISWNTLDDNDRIDEEGKYLVIDGMWIHPDFRWKGTLQRLVQMLWEKTIDRSYEFVVYNKEKYGGRKSMVYPASWFLKHTGVIKT